MSRGIRTQWDDAEPEPEIDYTTFNAKQKEKASSPVNGDPDDNDVDTSFAHLRLGPKSKPKPAGYINAADLVVMDEERKKADAARGVAPLFTSTDCLLILRFSAASSLHGERTGRGVTVLQASEVHTGSGLLGGSK